MKMKEMKMKTKNELLDDMNFIVDGWISGLGELNAVWKGLRYIFLIFTSPLWIGPFLAMRNNENDEDNENEE